jgi:hypothetical protein
MPSPIKGESGLGEEGGVVLGVLVIESLSKSDAGEDEALEVIESIEGDLARASGLQS